MSDGLRVRGGKVPALVLGALLSFSLAACGGDVPPSGPVTFPADALMSLPSDAGRFVVTVRTSPQPPVRGVDAVQLQIADGAGAPVDGLSIEAVPWMPAHGHGTSTQPHVEPQGGGVYEITNVNLYMAGLWELRSTLQFAEGADTVAPAFDVR
ncbi:MAG TPA: FixH family protein [Polyangia bacterium]